MRANVEVCVVIIEVVCVRWNVKVGEVGDEVRVVFVGELCGAMSILMAVACAHASPIAARLY